MEAVFEPLGFKVRSFFSSQGGSTLPEDTSLAVCTIEKANTLVNKLLEDGRLGELGIVVIDEIHMVRSLSGLWVTPENASFRPSHFPLRHTSPTCMLPSAGMAKVYPHENEHWVAHTLGPACVPFRWGTLGAGICWSCC